MGRSGSCWVCIMHCCFDWIFHEMSDAVQVTAEPLHNWSHYEFAHSMLISLLRLTSACSFSLFYCQSVMAAPYFQVIEDVLCIHADKQNSMLWSLKVEPLSPLFCCRRTLWYTVWQLIYLQGYWERLSAFLTDDLCDVSKDRKYISAFIWLI